MKRMMAAALLAATLVTRTEADYKEPAKIRCTVYTANQGETTADGSKVRQGIVAGRKEWLGKTALLYDSDMNFIGFYEFRDTGGTKALKSGNAIDVYRDSDVDCQEWIDMYGDYIYLQIVDAKG